MLVADEQCAAVWLTVSCGVEWRQTAANTTTVVLPFIHLQTSSQNGWITITDGLV